MEVSFFFFVKDVLSEQIINSCTPMNGKPQLTVEDIVVKVIYELLAFLIESVYQNGHRP